MSEKAAGDWTPIFVLPNIDMRAEVEAAGVTIVSADDQRVQQLARAHPNFNIYLRSFTTEFGEQRAPSVMLRRTDAPNSFRYAAALASFRDALALSTIPIGWARTLRFQSNSSIRYANTYSFYPWTIDAKYEGINMQSMAQLGWHEAKALHGQLTPGFGYKEVTEGCIDRPLLTELLVRWERCFTSDTPERSDTALFRSLNMAFSAAMLPGNVETTIYDVGRAIVLWASAIEILANSGNDSELKDVFKLLERIRWRLPMCAEATYEPYKYKQGQPKRPLPFWICGELFRARNDFIHGNDIENSRLVIAPAKRSLNLYAPMVYRMTLAAFLELKPRSDAPQGCQSDYEAHWSHMFEFGKYQQNIEEALSTILFTEEEYRAQRHKRPSRRQPIPRTT